MKGHLYQRSTGQREGLAGIVLVSLALTGLISMPSFGQSIEVRGGNPTLSITTAVPGSEPTAVTNSTTSIRYRQQIGTITKVTVSTVCPDQNFTLKVLAVSPQRGVPAPEVTLIDGMPDADFVTNIPAAFLTRRTCTLRYTASATFAQGNSVELGADVHTVTYTLVAQ